MEESHHMPHPHAASEPTHQQCNEERKPRVLLADDEEPVRVLTTRILARQGWEVTAVSDGRAAVAAWPSDGSPFDLVILDVRMPGMSGGEACGGLGRIHPEAHFLFISGYIGEEERTRLPKGERIAFLAKPFSPGELLAEARALLHREPANKM